MVRALGLSGWFVRTSPGAQVITPCPSVRGRAAGADMVAIMRSHRQNRDTRSPAFVPQHRTKSPVFVNAASVVCEQSRSDILWAVVLGSKDMEIMEIVILK